jgi:hypothetical protein
MITVVIGFVNTCFYNDSEDPRTPRTIPAPRPKGPPTRLPMATNGNKSPEKDPWDLPFEPADSRLTRLPTSKRPHAHTYVFKQGVIYRGVEQKETKGQRQTE